MARMPVLLGRLVAAAVCLSAAGAAVPGSALADLWVSSSGTDSGYCSQANPCATISRAVSLAIPNDTIYIAPGSYTDHVLVPAPTPTQSVSGLTLQGAGMHLTTVSGGGFNTPGSVFAIAPGNTVTIADMTITGGVAPNGGGVANEGDLTLERTDITENVAAATTVGAAAAGGGVWSLGPLTLTDSAVVANVASDAGGGVWMESGTAARDLIGSNLVSTTSPYPAGGGLFLAGGDASTDTIVNNKVLDGAGNPAGAGGGVYATDSAEATVTSSTIVNNTAGQDGGVGGHELGLAYSILAANHGGDCDPGIHGATDNVDVDGSCSYSSFGEIVGVDPQLGPLADNGGPTQTMAIPSSSPAYDAHAADCAGTDQRGVSLLQRAATSCDIGAYQVSAPTTYVANQAANSVTAYASGASGDAAPVLRLAGAATGLNAPAGVVTDVNGDVFVANTLANSVTQYAPEVTGNVTPIATIAGSRTRLNRPQDLALDSAGHLYVANYGGSVTEYAAGARGNASPVARIAGTNTGLSRPRGIVIDPDGNLRVTDSGTVLTFAPQATGNVAPLSRLTSSALTGPRGLNFDSAGDLLVAAAGAHDVLMFAPGAAGAAQPSASLKGPAPGLSAPSGLDVDVTGDLFVSDATANSILEFPRITIPTPLATILGPDTGLSRPMFLSELPPTPAPRLRAFTARRLSRKRLLTSGIVLGLRAAGSMAFRGQPVLISAVARVRHTIIATAKPTPLRPGRLTLRLPTTRRAAAVLRRRRRRVITVTITVRGDAGTQRHRLTISCTG